MRTIKMPDFSQECEGTAFMDFITQYTTMDNVPYDIDDILQSLDDSLKPFGLQLEVVEDADEVFFRPIPLKQKRRAKK